MNNYKYVLKEIEDGKVKPVYVCFGQEKYLMNEFIQRLTKQLIKPDEMDFALSKYDLTETRIDSVIEDAETLPFMVERKVIIANDAQFLTSAKPSARGLKVEHNIDALMNYIQNPVDFTILVITVLTDKMDERKKIVKWLKEMGCVIPFQPLNAEDLFIWISVQFDKHKCIIDREGMECLILNAGTNLQVLSAEIEKLTLFTGRGQRITPEIIEQLVVRNTEQNVFKLIEEICSLRVDQAFTILYDLLKQREEPVKILMLIARQFRMMMQVKELTRQSYSHKQIASQLKLHPYAVKIAEDQGKRYDEGKLSDIISQLAELDYQMKTGKTEKVMGLELFLLKLSV